MKKTDLKKTLEELVKIDPVFLQTEAQNAVKFLGKHIPVWPDAQKARKKNALLLEKALAAKRPRAVSFYRFAVSFSAAAAVVLVLVTGSWYWLNRPVAQKELWATEEKLPASASQPDQAEKPVQTLPEAEIDGNSGFAPAKEDTRLKDEELPKLNKFSFSPEIDKLAPEDGLLILPSATGEKKETADTYRDTLPDTSSKMNEADSFYELKLESNYAMESQDDQTSVSPGFLSELESGTSVKPGSETVLESLELVLGDLLPANSVAVMPAFSSDSLYVVFRGSQSKEDGLGLTNLEKTSSSAQFVPLLSPENWTVHGNQCLFVGRETSSWDIVEIKKATQKDMAGLSGNMVASNSSTQKMQLAASGPLWLELKADSSEAALTEWALMAAGYLPRRADVYQKILAKINEDPRILSKTQNIVLMSSYLFNE
jgi:hypothetical protein